MALPSSRLLSCPPPPADVKFVGSQEVLASASSDRTTKLWRAEGEGYACAATLSDQAGAGCGARCARRPAALAQRQRSPAQRAAAGGPCLTTG